MGKRRDGLLVKRGRDCRMVEGLRPEMLSDVAKIKGGNRDTSPVMLVGNYARLGEEDRSTESEDLQSPLSRWLIIRR